MKKSKLLVILLTLVMLVSLLPTAAFAEEPAKPEISDEAKDALKGAADKFLEDPQGSVRKIKLIVHAADLILDVGEGVADVLIFADKIVDTKEDAEFEMEALRDKIQFDLDNIGKPDDPIGEAQKEIDWYQKRELHEKEQINKKIDNINKIIGLGEKLTGKELPEVPPFEWFPQPEVDLKNIIEGAIGDVVGGILG